jgi:flagellar biogenesis protein FliO
VLGPPPGPPLAARPAARSDPAAARRDTAPATGRPRSAAEAFAAPAAGTSAAPPGGSAAAAATAATAATPGPRPLGQALATEGDDAWSRISMYAALGLGAAGLGVWLLRRRRARPGPAASIEVIAQRSLGGKARIVWLSAGQREMIVSVTAQQVRMLGQWRTSDAPAALPAAHTYTDADADAAPRRDPAIAPAMPPLPADRPVSPALSGLLRLRGLTGQMPAVVPLEDDGTDGTDGIDSVADARWAREILAATGARR